MGRIVTVQLEHGATVDQADKDGYTPLYVASGRGYIRIVELLLDARATVDQADQCGTTPLLFASGVSMRT